MKAWWSPGAGQGRFVRVPASELVRFGRSRYRRHPQGLGPNRDEAEAGGYFDEIDQGTFGTTRATPALAARLHVEPGAPLSLVHYPWLVAGQPTQISTQWEPLRLIAETPVERPSSSARGQPSVIARFDAIGDPDHACRGGHPSADATCE
jgi:hypothetical protein